MQSGSLKMRKANGAMTVEQARKRFAGNWMALEVVSRDRNRFPRTVRLIAKARTKEELYEKVRAFADMYIAFAGPVVPKGSVALY
jgi:thiazole synthase ThiGH ThiG subunit